MCGSLLSKFKKPSNRVYPETLIFPEPRRVWSQTKLANKGSACYEDRGFWKDGDRNSESSVHTLVRFSSKTPVNEGAGSEADFSSQKEIELEAARALDCAKPVLPAINSTYVELPLVERNSEHLLESAREILAFQVNGASSSSNTVAAQPLSSTNSTLPKIKTALAFDILDGNERTICSSARVPRRLRKRGKVAPELTLEDVKEKMRAAEERKRQELERIRECARSKAGRSRPHPAEVSAQATKEKIAEKQAAAARKREQEMENRRQAGNRASQKISRIAEARAFARTQLNSSIEQKMEEIEKRKVNGRQKTDRQKKQKQLREQYAKKVMDRVSFLKVYTGLYSSLQDRVSLLPEKNLTFIVWNGGQFRRLLCST